MTRKLQETLYFTSHEHCSQFSTSLGTGILFNIIDNYEQRGQQNIYFKLDFFRLVGGTARLLTSVSKISPHLSGMAASGSVYFFI